MRQKLVMFFFTMWGGGGGGGEHCSEKDTRFKNQIFIETFFEKIGPYFP